MQERYRKDYDGELVVTSVRYIDGKRDYNKEWIANPLELESISGRATCVTDSESLDGFHIKRLQNHHGGLLGTLALHVYATDALYKQFKPNFLVTFNDEYLTDMIDQKLTEDIIVYTSTKKCLQYPGEMFMVPYSVKNSPEVIAAWLACFDGHEEVLLFGYDEHNREGGRRQKMIIGMKDVMETYDSIKFTWVSKFNDMPDEWRHLRNLKKMTIGDYISYCDIS